MSTQHHLHVGVDMAHPAGSHSFHVVITQCVCVCEHREDYDML